MPNAAQVVVAGNGSVYVGITSTPAPTDATTALNAGFKEMGFISEDGATFTEGKDITDIGAWQSFYPLRKIITGRTVQVAFALREWRRPAVEFALGGTVSGTAPGPYSYIPPAPELLATKSLVLNWVDASKNYRLYIPVGLVTETVETTFARTAAADLPVTFSATDPGGANIYTLFTNDPAFSS